ncbi:TIR domain-containing protein [Thermoanaerobacterium sp. DL9XJH110]|uniref:TIR domain-containing protein n=1 Tax=Thermoanaerobacterium sp. DL9XJH110 TaxID=3386643 RepID=UPI003BB6AAE3
MPELKTYDIFISHAWKYGTEYDRLINLLDNAPYFYYRNYSAPKDKPLVDPNTSVGKLFLREAIDRKIKPVNIVLVLSGMYAAYREWMQYEIDTAQKYYKPIIGIVPWGQERIPSEVQKVSLEMVRWNTDSIISAIRRYAI